MMQPPITSGENVLARRLTHYVPLSDDEVQAIDLATDGLTRTLAARRDLVREGDPPHAVFLFVSGWACRYKTLADGRRQIVAFLLPGDLCDVNNHVLDAMDHAIGALTPVRYVELPHHAVEALATSRPRVGRALWRQLLAGIAIQREWTLNTGQRSAIERIAHLFCELHHLLRPVGLASATGYDFPLTQNDLAEATGLTPVHVNRTLQEMRASGLIVLKDRVLDFPDLRRLQETAFFTPGYLHQGSPEVPEHGSQGDVEGLARNPASLESAS